MSRFLCRGSSALRLHRSVFREGKRARRDKYFSLSLLVGNSFNMFLSFTNSNELVSMKSKLKSGFALALISSERTHSS